MLHKRPSNICKVQRGKKSKQLVLLKQKTSSKQMNPQKCMHVLKNKTKPTSFYLEIFWILLIWVFPVSNQRVSWRIVLFDIFFVKLYGRSIVKLFRVKSFMVPQSMIRIIYRFKGNLEIVSSIFISEQNIQNPIHLIGSK